MYAWEIAPAPLPLTPADTRLDAAEVERLAAQDVWRVGPSSKPAGGDLEPLSADWFRYLDDKRNRKQGRWVSSLLEVTRHANESVLAMGDGLGLDWVRFAEGGANVSVVDPSTERLKLYRQQFSARGVKAQCLHSPFDRLPASDSEVDVVCAVFNERPATWASLVQETQRVLRPGGKVIAVLPAHFNADRLLDIHRPWRVWRRPVSAAPARFTAHELRKAFAGFYNVKVHKRHLRRSELPYIWRWVLLPIAERMMGRFLVVKAFKHLTAAMAAARAAA